MKTSKTIENPDVILIGSGIMSATLGTMLKELDPALKIQLYEMTERFALRLLAGLGWPRPNARPSLHLHSPMKHRHNARSKRFALSVVSVDPQHAEFILSLP